MSDLLARLRLTHPIFLAPMGGGPGTAELAAAVANAGGLGAVAGAYLTAAEIGEVVGRTRGLTSRSINVNLFAGGYHHEIDRDPAPMLALLAPIHEELRIPAPSMPDVNPDPLAGKYQAVLEARPEAFSFTFGIPPEEVLREFRSDGIFVIGTATSAREAEMLADAGVDAIVAQGAEAGAHRGAFAEDGMVPTLELVRQIRGTLPVIASGGLMDAEDVRRALDAGADAVQLGTAFLLCPEAGTSQAYREALKRGGESVITRAFSGRAARGLRNRFHEIVDEAIILPFPIQNSLTRPMRAAAAKARNADYLSLWAGTGLHKIREAPAAEIVSSIARGL